MLKNVRDMIDSVSKMNFEEYFTNYICAVQDSNIDMEFDYLMHKNAITIHSMESLIKNTYERLCLNDNCE